ncbi:hypothetical protein F5Y08DRAFT_298895 [Xylaria arbuscula]|uniref:Histone deacetylase complex subunit SAP30 Sin3 binding domain-containing protein n=1 Tax=Xylaria arbuscula TaxID=114810 RepID=A0A9W8NN60_9PEZI|nr:hypothetical protein F5Y08DRAFT_298895 [Xylaria arbuscula]KAJ3579944.1 hypothetical protein NPX13_g620 [Xylaria arbuscula]
MPAPKSKANHDDAKSDTASLKERNGHGSKDNHKPNGKLQRVASSTGSQLKEITSAKGSTATPAAPAPQPIPPGLQWSTFDRDVLHDYRREHRLDTPTAFSSSYRFWVLSQSSVGKQSPTMARRAQFRRQSKDDLATVVRRHFNGVGVQENDVIVDFLHKVRNPGVSKPRRNKELPHSSPLP